MRGIRTFESTSEELECHLLPRRGPSEIWVQLVHDLNERFGGGGGGVAFPVFGGPSTSPWTQRLSPCFFGHLFAHPFLVPPIGYHTIAKDTSANVGVSRRIRSKSSMSKQSTSCLESPIRNPPCEGNEIPSICSFAREFPFRLHHRKGQLTCILEEREFASRKRTLSCDEAILGFPCRKECKACHRCYCTLYGLN